MTDLEPRAIYMLRVVQGCECKGFVPQIVPWLDRWAVECGRCHKVWALVQKEDA